MTPRTKKWLLVLAALVLGVAAVDSLRSPEERATWDAAADRAGAEGACIRAFRMRAHDPGSVQADRVVRYDVADGGQTAAILISLRARNATGGLVLTTALCDLVRVDGTHWQATTVAPAVR